MIFGKEPAFWIGVIAAVVLAVLDTLGGKNLLSGDVINWVHQALDPNMSGWALPILIGLVTRFFVSPATKPGL